MVGISPNVPTGTRAYWMRFCVFEELRGNAAEFFLNIISQADVANETRLFKEWVRMVIGLKLYRAHNKTTIIKYSCVTIFL